MQVEFVTTTADNLEEIDIINGQIIYISDEDSSYYDMGGSRHLVSGAKLVPALPNVGQTNVIYIQLMSDGRAVLSVWDATNNAFVTVSNDVAMPVVTSNQYKLLPAAKKTANFAYFVTDATSMADLT